jgi:hypothetical protein
MEGPWLFRGPLRGSTVSLVFVSGLFSQGNSLFIAELVVTRCSAASAIAWPTTSLFGFRKAVMASLSWASTKAFLLALLSAAKFTLLLLEREVRLRDASESSLLVFLMPAGSLPSRLMLGTEADVADRINAIMLLGPRDTLRRCNWSVDRALCKVRCGFIVDGRLVAVPGFCSFLLDERFCDLEFDEMITGPPSFRLIASHSCGMRAEKLRQVSRL